MPNAKYLRGRAAEQLLKRRLEADGFHCTRSAGSKGRWDVVAVWPGGCVLLIQVKSLQKGVSHKAVLTEFHKKCITESSSYIQMLCVRQGGKWFYYRG